MNPVLRKQLHRYRRRYRRHLMMQHLKGTLFNHDEGGLPLIAKIALVLGGIALGLLFGFVVLARVFRGEEL
ncbi:MAG: hypothetical protein GXX99_00640 [Clostridiales bacterium]|nr:hypothetical protein [Clostridiales bacterium]